MDVDADADTVRHAVGPVAEGFAMTWALDVGGRPVRTLVMVSTAAHCLNDLLFRQRSGQLPVEIPAIVSNHTDLAPLGQDIETQVLARAVRWHAEHRVLVDGHRMVVR